MFTLLMATSVTEGWGRMQAKHPSFLAWKNSHIPSLSREPLSRTPRLPLQDPQGPMEDGQGARAGCPQCNILCPPEAGVGAWIWQHSTTLPVAGSRQGSQVGFGAALWWYCPLPPDDNKNAQNFCYPSLSSASISPVIGSKGGLCKILQTWVEKGTKLYCSILVPRETATGAASPATGPDPAGAGLLVAPCAIHGATGPFQPLLVQLPADRAAWGGARAGVAVLLSRWVL